MKILTTILTIITISQIAFAQENYHPADINQDWHISVQEFDAYNKAWQNKENWSVGPNPIDMDYVTRAGFLAMSGQRYRFDESQEGALSWQCDPYETCKAILDVGKSHGDGIYMIDPDGEGIDKPFQVYCDMTTDGGGWMLVLQQTKDGNNTQLKNGESNPGKCLLNTEEDCSQPSFLDKSLIGTSYMKRVTNSRSLVVKFSEPKTWWDMSVTQLSEYTYFADDPSTLFKGYSRDSSPGTSGCQDLATTTWGADTHGFFAHADGNSGCSDDAEFSWISNSSPGHQNDSKGAYWREYGHYQYGFVYLR